MATAVVKVPFQDDLLQQIDQIIMKKEARSRADLILAATKMYIERKLNWQDIFSYGDQSASSTNLAETDVIKEIKAHRNGK